MGTRHLICVVKNGEYKVAQYGQWDGYPDGQGLGILTFLQDSLDRTKFDNKINQLSFATEEELKQTWIEAGANPNEEFVTMEVSDKHKKLYPEDSRDTGSNILSLVQNSDRKLKLDNSLDFASDSLFCEWAYVIDLDKNTFEVYEGFNKSPLDKTERFYFLQEDNKYAKDHRKEDQYYPVKYVVNFSLDELPTEEEFLNHFKNDNDED